MVLGKVTGCPEAASTDDPAAIAGADGLGTKWCLCVATTPNVLNGLCTWLAIASILAVLCSCPITFPFASTTLISICTVDRALDVIRRLGEPSFFFSGLAETLTLEGEFATLVDSDDRGILFDRATSVLSLL